MRAPRPCRTGNSIKPGSPSGGRLRSGWGGALGDAFGGEPGGGFGGEARGGRLRMDMEAGMGVAGGEYWASGGAGSPGGGGQWAKDGKAMEGGRWEAGRGAGTAAGSGQKISEYMCNICIIGIKSKKNMGWGGGRRLPGGRLFRGSVCRACLAGGEARAFTRRRAYRCQRAALRYGPAAH